MQVDTSIDSKSDSERARVPTMQTALQHADFVDPGAGLMIDARQIAKRFGTHTVLRDVSMGVSKGEVVALIGASGSGKSTLLRCLNLLEVPDAGSLRVGEHRFEFRPTVAKAGPKVAARPAAMLRRDIGMVFQHFNLYPHMSVLGNVVEGPIRVRGMARRDAHVLGEALLEKVGLADKRDQFPARLSGGQRQRVAIARALAMEPKAMLFDEATSALDPELVGEVLQVMRDLAKEGMTMILVTHEMAFAREIADRICFMDGGTIAMSGPPAEMFQAARDTRLGAFLERFHQR
jgi:polar amino acid transport system ATP-binding protein